MNVPSKSQSPLKTGMSNLSVIGGEYPKMLYRQTDEEQRYIQTTHDNGDPKSWLVTNCFNGLLCDTVVADSADDAETLAQDGWDVSPEAAHGVVKGLVAETTAKDARIAELEAMLAMQVGEQESTGDPQPVRRGRPPKVVDDI